MFTPTPRIHFRTDLPKPPADRLRVVRFATSAPAFASNTLGCQGCPYPKLGQLRRADTSGKALARSPKLDFPPTLPQILDDGSLEEAITGALAAASPDESESLCAHSLSTESSQESETSAASRDDAPLALRPLAVAEVAHPAHRQVRPVSSGARLMFSLIDPTFSCRCLVDALSVSASF